jgi:hypothetical protein
LNRIHRCLIDENGGDYAKLAFQSFLQFRQHLRRLHHMGCMDDPVDPLSPVSSTWHDGFETKPIKDQIIALELFSK